VDVLPRKYLLLFSYKVNNLLPWTNMLSFPQKKKKCTHCYLVASYLLLCSLDEDHQKKSVDAQQESQINEQIYLIIINLVVIKMKQCYSLTTVWAYHGRSSMRCKLVLDNEASAAQSAILLSNVYIIEASANRSEASYLQ
jgi:hypothetical protein